MGQITSAPGKQAEPPCTRVLSSSASLSLRILPLKTDAFAVPFLLIRSNVIALDHRPSEGTAFPDTLGPTVKAEVQRKKHLWFLAHTYLKITWI